MSNIPTPHKFLEAIQRNAFKDIDLTQLLTMDQDHQRDFTLEQMERMLSMPNVYTAEWLSDQFWTADKELIMMYDPHPWLENEYEMKKPEEMSDLSGDEYELAKWIVKLALFSHNLVVTHMPFPLDMLKYGLEDPILSEDEQFHYGNTALVRWIRTTPYRRVAALVCYQVLDTETDWAIRSNQAVQDFYALECWHYKCDWRELDKCEEFTKNALDGMQQIKEHYEKAHQAGLNDEEIRVLDALVGFAPHDILEDDFPFVRDVCEAAEKHLPSKPYITSEQGLRQYAKAVFDDLKQIFAKYEVPFDPSDLTDLTPGYLDKWVYDKYYDE